MNPMTQVKISFHLEIWGLKTGQIGPKTLTKLQVLNTSPSLYKHGVTESEF